MQPKKPLLLIRRHYNILSARQKGIADYILQNTARCESLTINRLAEACHTTVTTVARFMGKLGYSSYRTFRMDLVREATGTTGLTEDQAIRIEDGYQSIEPGDDMDTVKRKVSRSAGSAVADMGELLDSALLTRAVKLLAQARHIVFFGAGGSSVIAMDAYHKFIRLGVTVCCDSNSHFALLRSVRLTTDDVMVLVSHSGESREVLECAQNAKEAGCPVIGITSYSDSTLAGASDVCLCSSAYDRGYYTDAMVSRLLQLTIMDMLFVGVCLRMGDRGSREIALSRRAISVAKKGTRG